MYDLVQPIFHTDKIRNNKLFLSRKTLLMASNERIWLGAGMYFWDNISNAKYWKRQKKKHDRYSAFSIIEASLRCNLDDLLNLTDEKTVEELQEYVEKCKKLYHHQTGIEIDLDSMKTGEIINFAYKCSELFDNGKTFKCVEEKLPSNYLQLIQNNAATILFPYLRSVISQITLLGNEYSPIILPLINVESLKEKHN